MRTQVATTPRLSALPLLTRHLVLAHCHIQGCQFVASATSEASVLRGLACHVKRIHVEKEQES